MVFAWPTQVTAQDISKGYKLHQIVHRLLLLPRQNLELYPHLTFR